MGRVAGYDWIMEYVVQVKLSACAHMYECAHNFKSQPRQNQLRKSATIIQPVLQELTAEVEINIHMFAVTCALIQGLHQLRLVGP